MLFNKCYTTIVFITFKKWENVFTTQNVFVGNISVMFVSFNTRNEYYIELNTVFYSKYKFLLWVLQHLQMHLICTLIFDRHLNISNYFLCQTSY